MSRSHVPASGVQEKSCALNLLLHLFGSSLLCPECVRLGRKLTLGLPERLCDCSIHLKFLLAVVIWDGLPGQA